MKQTTLRLPPEIDEQLQEIAAKQYTSKNHLLIKAAQAFIKEYVEQSTAQKGDGNEQRKKPGRG